MPLHLQPAIPSDASALTQIFFSAFHPEDPFEALIYPYGATPKAMEHGYKSIAKNFEDPNVYYLKVVDTEIAPDNKGSEIIAWARWKIWREERPQELWDVSWQLEQPDLSKAKDGVIDDVDVRVEQVFYDKLQEMRRKYIRDMSSLCTRPTQQRRGAASMLLKWGMNLADREGLDIFAQASPMILSSGGASSFGFEAVEAWYLDANMLGRDEPERNRWPLRKMLMRRRPSNKSSDGAETKDG
ncbi:hypothetical protein BP5796_12415 [Coleophoma crateriformis]|uniref:N-acetyltransferase domain-containing protein n=1 Tax=Coleophoma crateriformis TaxID=565419 RepID=A0A3D8Q9G5_9HELO|nr:hypothetical protein BP5796_12415 [Coleophoma crateriformis]